MPDFQSVLLGEAYAQAPSSQASGPRPANGSTQAASLRATAASGGPATASDANVPVLSGGTAAFWSLSVAAAGKASKSPDPRAPAKAPTPSPASPVASGENVAAIAVVPLAQTPAPLPGSPVPEPAAARSAESQHGGLVSGDALSSARPGQAQVPQGAQAGQAADSGPAAQELSAMAQANAPGQGASTYNGMGGEKIAALPETGQVALSEIAPKPNKTSLEGNNQTVAKDFKSVGTSVAMPTATMTAAAVAQPPTVALSGGATGFAGDAAGRAPGEAMVQQPATQAVEAALQVGDLQAAASQATQSAVNLKFNVAGEDLSVRVALQAGQVHTQFSTSSGELRTALAHEWQAVGSSTGAQDRFAAPVFTSGSRSDSQTSTDLGGEAGRQSGQNSNPSDGETPALGSPLAPAAVAQIPAAFDSEPETADATYSGRLQSFA